MIIDYESKNETKLSYLSSVDSSNKSAKITKNIKALLIRTTQNKAVTIKSKANISAGEIFVHEGKRLRCGTCNPRDMRAEGQKRRVGTGNSLTKGCHIHLYEGRSSKRNGRW